MNIICEYSKPIGMCNTLSAIGVGARWLLHEHHLECTSWQAEALISSYNYESTRQHIYIYANIQYMNMSINIMISEVWIDISI